MAAKVAQGVTAPVTLTGSVAQGNSGLDLTTVTSVTLVVYEPDRTTQQTWSANIQSATAALLTFAFPFTGVEIPAGAQLGTWMVAPLLHVPAGTVQCPGEPLIVVMPWQL